MYLDNDSGSPDKNLPLEKDQEDILLTPTQNSLEGDVFAEDNNPDHQLHYRTLSWQFISLLMISEIVSNGMLSLPSALAAVGLVPAVILIVFLGIFGLFTAKLLVDFKLNHPNVHTMGDAGFIMGGPVAREILSTGTVIFAICGTGSVLLSGQQALTTLADGSFCAIYLALFFSIAALLVALPRTLDGFRWLGLISVLFITLSGILGMFGAGLNPKPHRVLSATIPTNFYQAFLAITNPVFSYAGHFMFFILISEMKRPQDAMKAAWCLQVFATLFYTLSAVVIYVYIGNTVASPAFFSLPPIWAKITFGVALPNFLVAAGLYSHTAAKIIFVRLFRRSRHLYTHTVTGWSVWVILCVAAVGIALVLAIAVPIFSDLIGITASLFASWYTYGIAGFFWLHDTFYLQGGRRGLISRPIGLTLALLTILAGAFMCVAGTYVTIQLIVNAYKDGLVGKPFSC